MKDHVFDMDYSSLYSHSFTFSEELLREMIILNREKIIDDILEDVQTEIGESRET